MDLSGSQRRGYLPKYNTDPIKGRNKLPDPTYCLGRVPSQQRRILKPDGLPIETVIMTWNCSLAKRSCERHHQSKDNCAPSLQTWDVHVLLLIHLGGMISSKGTCFLGSCLCTFRLVISPPSSNLPVPHSLNSRPRNPQPMLSFCDILIVIFCEPLCVRLLLCKSSNVHVSWFACLFACLLASSYQEELSETELEI